MKIQMRTGVFETNSSSTHAISICTQKDYNAFKKGKLLWDTWDEELVLPDDIPEENRDEEDPDMDLCDKRYLTKEDFDEYYGERFEMFDQKFTTPGGEKVIAFGYYGYDY